MERIGRKVSQKPSEITDENDSISVQNARAGANLNRKKRSPSPILKVEAKKLKISAEEAHMSGAPEGDLFDITVVPDESLAPLNLDNTVDAIEKKLRETLASITEESATWADRFTAVEFIRRVVLSSTHRSIIAGDCVVLTACLESCLHAVSSLRSCSVRNGLLALSALVQHVPAVVQPVHATLLVHTILSGKLVDTGPKFIVESAQKLVADTIAGMDPLVAVSTLQPSTQHRSAEVSTLSYKLIAAVTMRMGRSYLGLSETKSIEDDEDDDEGAAAENEETHGLMDELEAEAHLSINRCCPVMSTAGNTNTIAGTGTATPAAFSAAVATRMSCEGTAEEIRDDDCDDPEDGDKSVVLDSHMDAPAAADSHPALPSPWPADATNSGNSSTCSAASTSASASAAASSMQLSSLHPCLQLLHRGLSARKPAGREACRAAFSHLQAILGVATLNRVAQQACSEIGVIEIHREINRYSASRSPSPSPSPSAKRTAAARLGQTIPLENSSRLALGVFGSGFGIQGQALLPQASPAAVETPTAEHAQPKKSQSTTNRARQSLSASSAMILDRASTGKLSVREQMQHHRLQYRLQSAGTDGESDGVPVRSKFSELVGTGTAVVSKPQRLPSSAGGGIKKQASSAGLRLAASASASASGSSAVKSKSGGGIFIFEDM